MHSLPNLPSRMNHRILDLAMFLAALSGTVDARDFTDTKGRKLSGDLVGVNGSNALIKRPDGTSVNVPIAMLSGDDQKYVADNAASLIHADFDIKTAKTKLGKRKKRINDTTIEIEEWAYKVTLTNRSSTDLPATRVDYWIFRRDDDGKNKSDPKVESAGSKEIAAMKKNATCDFQTNPITLTKEQLDADFYYIDGSRNKSRDTAGGIAIRVFQGNKQLFEWASDKKLLASAKGPVAGAPEEKQEQ